jgi:DNA-binding transcriptional regulator YdaS (Cro superfamily)
MNEIHPLDMPDARRQIVNGGFSHQVVNHWRNRGTPVKHCAAVERLTDGKVTRKMLRPNDWHIYWPELAEPSVQIPVAGQIQESA